MADPLTARVFTKRNRYLWACLACQRTMPGQRFRDELSAITDASLHNGREHGDGSVELARGLLDPLLLRGGDCEQCGQLFGTVPSANTENLVLVNDVVVPLPLTVTRKQLADSARAVKCLTDRVPLGHLVLDTPS